MSTRKFLFTILIASMVLSKTQAMADYDSCEFCDYDGCGYSDCRRSACLMVAFALGIAVFTGIYFIILEDSKGSHSHSH